MINCFRQFLILSFTFATCIGCSGGTGVAGNSGKKQTKASSGQDESLGNKASSESTQDKSDNDSEKKVTTDETTSEKKYDDSKAVSPQSVSGAYLVCPRLDPPPGNTESAEFFGCAATIDGDNLLEFGDFDAVWSVYDTQGKKLPITQIDAPARSYFHKVFKTDLATLNVADSVKLKLSNKSDETDSVLLQGKILKTEKGSYPQENDIDPCPVCP